MGVLLRWRWLLLLVDAAEADRTCGVFSVLVRRTARLDVGLAATERTIGQKPARTYDLIARAERWAFVATPRAERVDGSDVMHGRRGRHRRSRVGLTGHAGGSVRRVARRNRLIGTRARHRSHALYLLQLL